MLQSSLPPTGCTVHVLTVCKKNNLGRYDLTRSEECCEHFEGKVYLRKYGTTVDNSFSTPFKLQTAGSWYNVHDDVHLNVKSSLETILQNRKRGAHHTCKLWRQTLAVDIVNVKQKLSTTTYRVSMHWSLLPLILCIEQIPLFLSHFVLNTYCLKAACLM